MTDHAHRMLRHPLVFRTLELLRADTLPPHMRRIVFGGESLRGFLSAAPDDHVKLLAQPQHGPLHDTARVELPRNVRKRGPGALVVQGRVLPSNEFARGCRRSSTRRRTHGAVR